MSLITAQSQPEKKRPWPKEVDDLAGGMLSPLPSYDSPPRGNFNLVQELENIGLEIQFQEHANQRRKL